MMLFKIYGRKLGRILFGFTLISFAVLLTKQSQCLSPWNVLNDGVSCAFAIPLGQASIWVGAAILLLDILAKEKLGFGTVLDILAVGWITDLLFWINGKLDLIPRVDSLPLQVVFCFVALWFNAFGIYFCVSAAMCGGPRDTLYIYLKKKLPIPIGICKLLLEAAACLSGWLLGGEVGIGTLVSVLLGGPILQYVFRLFQFRAAEIRHESIRDTLKIFADACRARTG